MDKYNNALSYFKSKKYNEAIELCNEIVMIDKNHYYTWNLLGNIFFNINDLKKAKQFLVTAINLKLDFTEAYYMLGNVLFASKLYEESIKTWKESLKYKDSESIIFSNIAISYIKLHNYTEAKKFANKALSIDLKCEDAYLTLSEVFKISMDIKNMKKNLLHALELNSSNAKTNFELSYIYFIEKDYQKAYKHFEYRRYLNEEKSKYNYLPFQEYKQEKLNDKSLLIYHEQGFGDNIQFVRFLNIFKEQNISYGIQNCLNKLFSYNFPNIQFKKEIKSDDKYDYALPVMSIPYLFKNYDIQSTQYLNVKKEDIQNFTNKYIDKSKINIGIVWAGSQTSKFKNEKTLKLDDFRSLFKKDRIFHSLQIDNNEELDHFKEIVNLGKDFTNFYDTAVAISALDLVISVDTAVAHLTGALGQKGFVLSNKMQFDWRWENNNKKSIWYDSLKIFKYLNKTEIIKEIDKDINEL